MRKLVAIALLFALATVNCYAQTPVGHPRSTCKSGNISEQDIKTSEAIGSFFDVLKQSVASNDRVHVAKLIHYPLNTLIKNKSREIRSESEFLRQYDLIFTPQLRKLIQRQQTSCISRVGAQGFSISEGEIWFDIYPDGQVRIFTINPVVLPFE